MFSDLSFCYTGSVDNAKNPDIFSTPAPTAGDNDNVIIFEENKDANDIAEVPTSNPHDAEHYDYGKFSVTRLGPKLGQTVLNETNPGLFSS